MSEQNIPFRPVIWDRIVPWKTFTKFTLKTQPRQPRIELNNPIVVSEMWDEHLIFQFIKKNI